jgi:acyl-CoA thioester hydrolase
LNAWLALPFTDSCVRVLCADSSCRYLRPMAYPQEIEIGLSISRLGRSSATYSLGIFSLPAVGIEGTRVSAARELCAEATYTHVYVDDDGRPMAMLDHTRRVLEELCRDERSGESSDEA